MSSPAFPNVFGSSEAFSGALTLSNMLEGIFENNGDGNPIYVGWSPIPDADPDAAVWYIQMIIYDGTAVVRKRLPDEGVKFCYIWSDRASLFS